MNIALASIFRNSQSYLARYFAQVNLLRQHLTARGDTLRLILAEGDSGDDTFKMLCDYSAGQSADVFKREHGGQVFGSVDHSERWRNISFVCNGVLERVRENDDALIYIESDLIWQVETMLNLVNHLAIADAVAAMCYHMPENIGKRFYDTWGHRALGECFSAHPPFHRALVGNAGELIEIDSAGSCIVMRGSVARVARFNPPELGIVGFGKDIHAHGFRLWLDPQSYVVHP